MIILHFLVAMDFLCLSLPVYHKHTLVTTTLQQKLTERVTWFSGFIDWNFVKETEILENALCAVICQASVTFLGFQSENGTLY